MQREKNSRCSVITKYQTLEKGRVSDSLSVGNKVWISPGLSVFHRSAVLLSLLSGVPMGPKLENGTELWLCVGGELGRLLGLEE